MFSLPLKVAIPSESEIQSSLYDTMSGAPAGDAQAGKTKSSRDADHLNSDISF